MLFAAAEAIKTEQVTVTQLPCSNNWIGLLNRPVDRFASQLAVNDGRFFRAFRQDSAITRGEQNRALLLYKFRIVASNNSARPAQPACINKTYLRDGEGH